MAVIRCVATYSSLLFAMVSVLACVSGRGEYDTVYACEGTTLNISCGEGELIELVRANFGRFSITICNKLGNTDWSVNCMSPKSLRVLQKSCGVTNSCSVHISAEQFGDSCPGTFKYIEVHYKCAPAALTTSTQRPRPPWHALYPDPSVWLHDDREASVPPSSSTASVNLVHSPTSPPAPTHIPTDNSSSIQTVISSTEPNTSSVRDDMIHRQDINKPDQANATHHHDGDLDMKNHQSSSTTPVAVTKSSTSTWAPHFAAVTGAAFTPPAPSFTHPPVITPVTSRRNPSDELADFDSNQSDRGDVANENVVRCKSTSARGILWPTTASASLAVLPCPAGAIGYARWKCSAAGTWLTSSPDLSECRSRQLSSLEQRLLDGETTLRISAELVTASRPLHASLLGGDVRLVCRLIGELATRLARQLVDISSSQARRAVVLQLTENVLRTVSHLLDRDQRMAWKDLDSAERARTITKMFIGIEQVVFLLAEYNDPGSSIVEIERHIYMTVVNSMDRDVDRLEFPLSSSNNQWYSGSNSLYIPQVSVRDSVVDVPAKVAFLMYSGMEEVLSLDSVTKSPSQPSVDARVINSMVMSASLGEGRHVSLSQPVTMTFRHIVTENVSNPSCNYWDYTLSSWSDEGCWVLSSNKTHTTCQCDHLTNFAVLMDSRPSPPAANERVLRVVVYVGGCVVMVAASAALLVLLAASTTVIAGAGSRPVQSVRVVLHRNLLVCVLLAELSMLLGVQQTDNVLRCALTAGLLQFWLLALLCWQTLDSWHIYCEISDRTTDVPRLTCFYLAGYGAPLVVVAVSCIVDPGSYGSSRHCWLASSNYFLLSFVAPACLFVTMSAVLLSLAARASLHLSTAVVTAQCKQQSRHVLLRGWLRCSGALFTCISLCICCQLVFLELNTLPLACLLTAAKLTLAVVIVLCLLVRNYSVREGLDRGSLLPSCLLEHGSLSSRRHGNAALCTSSGTVNTMLNCSQRAGHVTLWSSPAVPTTAAVAAGTHKSGTLVSLRCAGPAGGGIHTAPAPRHTLPHCGVDMPVFVEPGVDSGHGTGSEHEESPQLVFSGDRGTAVMERGICDGSGARWPSRRHYSATYRSPSDLLYQPSLASYHTYVEVDRHPQYEEIERHAPQPPPPPAPSSGRSHHPENMRHLVVTASTGSPYPRSSSHCQDSGGCMSVAMLDGEHVVCRLH